MAECVECGTKISWLYALCDRCHDANVANNSSAKPTDDPEQQRLDAAEQKLAQQELDAIILTTETAPNLNITKRIEIVTAECAFGMNIFKDLFAGVRDIVGGRSEAVQKTMRDSRKTVLYELKRSIRSWG